MYYIQTLNSGRVRSIIENGASLFNLHRPNIHGKKLTLPTACQQGLVGKYLIYKFILH